MRKEEAEKLGEKAVRNEGSEVNKNNEDQPTELEGNILLLSICIKRVSWWLSRLEYCNSIYVTAWLV